MSDESGADGSDGPADPEGPVEWLRWLWTTDHAGVAYVREVATSAGAVVAVGLLLFAASGVWPPMVAIESGSMQPNMGVGELVFVMDEERLSPDAAHGDTGVVTYRAGKEVDYRQFADYGDVIIYRPDNRSGTPVIHRARFWVNEGENWYDEASAAHVGNADDCEELNNCPAPNSGFITKGDNPATNSEYDQVTGLSPPVKPSWVVGTAEFGVPGLGYVKLCASGGGPCPLTPGQVVPMEPGTLAANTTRAGVSRPVSG